MLHVALGSPEPELLRLKTVDVIGSNLCPPEQCISTCISPSPARILAQRVDLRQSPAHCNMLQHIYCIISNLDAHLGTALHAIRFMSLEGRCSFKTTMHQIRFMPLEGRCLFRTTMHQIRFKPHEGKWPFRATSYKIGFTLFELELIQNPFFHGLILGRGGGLVLKI